MRKHKERYIFLAIAFVLLVSFFITYKYILPINYENISGVDSWLSGSTIKFVNSWLNDGILKLKFANVEYPASIELSTFMSREPYVSYPTGSTLLVWIFAKLLGKERIDIIYLKKFQCILYYIETLLISYTSYILLTKFTKFDRKCKIIFSLLISIFWIYLPANSWFLANVYFADQAIILWILLSYFIEVLETIDVVNKKRLFIIKELVILFGILTEYYYWIYIFFVCLFNFIRKVFIDRKLSIAIRDSLQYVIPVIVGLCLYLVQLSFVDDWQYSLIYKFQERTGEVENNNAFSLIFKNIAKYYSQKNNNYLFVMLCFIIIVIFAICLRICLDKEVQKYFVEKSINSLLALCISTILQLIVLKNHSAIHEFSVVKLGILYVYFFVIILIFMENKFGKKASIFSFFVTILFFSFIIGIPISAQQRVEKENNNYNPYELEHIIFENTNYNDICFSFTYEIVANPPQSLAISNKRVYLISKLSDINNFDNIVNANKLLIVEKNKLSNDLTKEIEKMQLIYNDSNYSIYKITN